MRSKNASRANEWRDSKLHRTLAMKAGKEARRVLGLFERELPRDTRPREAIDAILAWASRERKLDMVTVRRLSLAAHAAARAAHTGAAIAAARAAGQAVAAWHAPAHSLAAFSYAQKAIFADENEKGMRGGNEYSTEELSEALRAIVSLIGKLAKVQKKLRQGTPQHTLTKNRLKAFRVASALIRKEEVHSGRNRQDVTP